MHKLYKLLITLTFCIGLAHFCQKETGGFALTKIATALTGAGSATTLPKELHQRFYYFAKGGQSYVFLSEDGQFVLKLFRGSRRSLLNFFSSLWPSQWAKRSIKKQESEIKEALKSYQLAWSYLPMETGVIHVQTGSSGFLKIVDKLNIEHKIDLSCTPFVLQKRATPVKKVITDLMEMGRKEEAQRRLRSLFSLIGKRISLGIEDSDANLTKNFGFIDEEPIEIDPGRYLLATPTFDKITSSKIDLQNWLNQEYPSLSKDFDEAYHEFIKEYASL